MRPGETLEAPNMGMRVTCRESTADSDGRLLSFDLWMRGSAAPPPMHVHPHQEERILVVNGLVRSRSGGRDRVLSPGDQRRHLARRAAHGRTGSKWRRRDGGRAASGPRVRTVH